MTQPTQSQTATPSSHGPGIPLWIAVLAAITMLTVRWTGYAALPYLVIFAPLLAIIAVLVLAVGLAILAAILGGGE